MRLSAWLQQLQADPSVETRRRVTEAVLSMSSNAVPPLIKMLQTEDSRWKRVLINLSQRQSFIHFSISSAEQRRALAAEGLAILGPAAGSAIPALGEALNGERPLAQAAYALAKIGTDGISHLEIGLTNQKRSVRINSIAALGILGTNATAAILLLKKELGNPNPMMRSFAVRSLAQLGADNSNVVRLLAETLHDRSTPVRMWCISALAGMGDKAKLAVPTPLEIYGSDTIPIRREASLALQKIDPQTATMAGVTNIPSATRRTRR